MLQVVVELLLQLLAKNEEAVHLLFLQAMIMLQDAQQPLQLNRITQLACTESPDKPRINLPRLAEQT